MRSAWSAPDLFVEDVVCGVTWFTWSWDTTHRVCRDQQTEWLMANNTHTHTHTHTKTHAHTPVKDNFWQKERLMANHTQTLTHTHTHTHIHTHTPWHTHTHKHTHTRTYKRQRLAIRVIGGHWRQGKGSAKESVGEKARKRTSCRERRVGEGGVSKNHTYVTWYIHRCDMTQFTCVT